MPYATLPAVSEIAAYERWRVVLEDRVHGASVLTAKLLTIARQTADPGHPDALLVELADEVGKAHPGIPALLNAVHLLQDSLANGGDLPSAAKDLIEQIEKDQARVVSRAANLIAGHPRVMGISYSGLVKRALLAASKTGTGVRFFVGEGRPMGEGLLLARELATAGVACTVFADLAFAGFLPETQLAMVGADAVFSDSFINKVGTGVLLREARAARIPTALVYDLTKRVGEELRPSELPSRPPSEITGVDEGEAPPSLSVVNRYFEEVPLALIDHDLHQADVA